VKLKDIRAERDNKVAMILNYFSVIMAIFYFVAGLGFLFFPWFTMVGSPTREIVATLLMLYGIIRGYRIYVKIGKSNTINQQAYETEE
jgi:hypothetical protein